MEWPDLDGGQLRVGSYFLEIYRGLEVHYAISFAWDGGKLNYRSVEMSRSGHLIEQIGRGRNALDGGQLQEVVAEVARFGDWSGRTEYAFFPLVPEYLWAPYGFISTSKPQNWPPRAGPGRRER